jgi:hypothetical protein
MVRSDYEEGGGGRIMGEQKRTQMGRRDGKSGGKGKESEDEVPRRWGVMENEECSNSKAIEVNGRNLKVIGGNWITMSPKEA